MSMFVGAACRVCVISAACLMSGTAFGQAIVMGPGTTGFPLSVAPTGSNSVVQHSSSGDSAAYFPPLVYTDDLIANSWVPRLEGFTFVDGSYAFANHGDYAAYSTTATTSTINAAIRDLNYISPSGGSTVTAYSGSSQFFAFTLPSAANVTMAWATTLMSGVAPTSTVMFWDIYQNSPTPGSVASSNNVDTGSWSGALPAGQYSMIYTRHDSLTGTFSQDSNVISQFTLYAEIVPAPGLSALLMGLGLVGVRRQR